MKCVRPEDLSEGDICAYPVFDSGGRHLVKAGAVINPLIKSKLISSEIPRVYITSDIYFFSSPFEAETCANVLKAANCFSESDGSDKDLLKTYGTDDIKNIASYCGETASKIGYAHLFLYYGALLTGQALKNREKPYDIRDFRNRHNYSNYHPLGAACFSILIGREAGLNERELYELAAGAMLYDCKMKLYPFSKEGRKLTAQESAELSGHTEAGYDFLKNIYGLPAKSALIASQHHERYDGSGYPRGIRNESINIVSRIAAVADVYDAFVSDRPFRRAYSAEEAKNYILDNAGVLFDPAVCEAFKKCAVRFIPGSIVKLDDGMEAVVVRNNAANPDSPVIKLIEKKGGSVIISVTETDTAADNSRKIIQTITRGI